MRSSTILVLVLIGFLVLNVSSKPCALRKYSDGYVCVCNSTYCDTLEDVPSDLNGRFIVVSSSRGGLRFHVTQGEFDRNQSLTIHDQNRRRKFVPITVLLESSNVRNLRKRFIRFQDYETDKTVIITIDRSKTYQNITGFGGAFTGAVSHNFDKISNSLKYFIYKSYYSLTEGIGFNMMRIPIGGSDFDLKPWAYNEIPENDESLRNFTELDQRDLTRITQIEDLKMITENYDIKFMGATWSSPPWMKTNNRWTGASALRPEYYQTWADYHIKYLDLMAEKNFKFYGISTGNEPMNGVIGFLFVHFMSLGWTAKNQGKWVGENLGPTLKSKHPNVKLFAGDDQRYTFPWWFTQMESSNKKSMKYVDGLAVHWYWDGLVPPYVLDQAHEKYPNKILLNTESCVGDKPFEKHGPVLGSWDRAEKYISAILQDLNHWINGWIDWNLILDESGGPNYANNTVEAAIIVNVTSGDEAYKQPIFYVLGHFSKYFTPGSKRIDSHSSSSNVQTVSFQRPDDKIAVLVFNPKSHSVDIILDDRISGKIQINIPPKSVHTIVYS